MMGEIAANLKKLREEIGDEAVLVAVSKYSSDEQVLEAYDAGHRDFGENKAQDLDARRERLPDDIRWHFIGHLQRNKVKYIAPYAHMIHSADSLRLLRAIDKEARKSERVIPCLLQVHIAEEQSKFGLAGDEVEELIESGEIESLKNVHIRGLMGMATHTGKTDVVADEFSKLASLFEKLKKADLPESISMKYLSMGMSNDYKIALEKGSNMVRIGSAVFEKE